MVAKISAAFEITCGGTASCLRGMVVVMSRVVIFLGEVWNTGGSSLSL